MLQQLIDLGPFQWGGLLFGIVYIFLAANNRSSCWIFGFISCACIAVEDFTSTKLYSDGVLQIFYMIMALWGIWRWTREDKSEEGPIKKLSLQGHMYTLLMGAVGALLIAWVTGQFTDAAYPLVDAITTSFSVVATFLLVYRYLDNWYHWIWIDTVYVYLFFAREAPLFSLLYAVFLVLAVYGLVMWTREWKSRTNTI